MPALPVDWPWIVTLPFIGLTVGPAGPEQPASTPRRIIAVTIVRRTRSRFVLGSKKRSNNAKVNGTICRGDTGGILISGGTMRPLLVLVICTCAVCAVFPSAAVTGEATVQVVPAGAPVQERETL